VYRGGHLVAEEPACKVKKGESRYTFTQTLAHEKLGLFRAVIEGFPGDTLQDNNSNHGLVFTTGKPRVLLIDSHPRLAEHLERALREEGIEADVRPPQGMPTGLDDLQNYEMLILSNVPAAKLTQKQMEIIRIYVQDLGGGFLMLGGDQSFGLGGYYKTVVEELLPVRSDFEKEREKPSLAMVLIIDKSGSMAGQKMELAKEAAKGAIDLLNPRDKVGVIAFDSQMFWVSEIRPSTDRRQIADQISRITAGGGTVMGPPLEQALEALRAVEARFKHVILLTDGIPTDMADLRGIAAAMATSRITLSTVGIGDPGGEDVDKRLLEEMATAGKGRFYYTDDPSAVPQIFVQETIAANKSALKEDPFRPVVLQQTPVLANLDFAAAPPLLGHVQTRARPTGEVVLATETGDPLLAWWRTGLGMSIGFTSNAKTNWAGDWISWPGYSKFWAQVVRHGMRKSDAKGIQVQVETRHRRATVTLDAFDPGNDEFLNQAEVRLTVIDPQYAKHDHVLQQTAPGRYVAEFDTPSVGAYHLDLMLTQDNALLYRQSRGLVVGYPDELRLRPTNEELLRAIARASGGTYQPAPEEVFAERDRTARQALPLWPYLVTAAACLFVCDVALRRLQWVGRRPASRQVR
jgi:uncharacterized membrane protein